MGKQVKEIKYDVKTGKTTAFFAHKDFDFKIRTSVQTHEEDVDFQTEAVGVQLATLKGKHLYHKKLAKERQKRANQLRLEAQRLDTLSLVDMETSVEAKNKFDLLVSRKDELYKKLRSNRENGGYKSVVFEELGNLTKGIPEEDKIKIMASILEGQKEGTKALEESKND